MIHPALEPADENLLVFLTQRAKKSMSPHISSTFIELKKASGLPLRRVTTSLCRLHLCGRVSVRFDLNSKLIHVHILGFRPNIKENEQC